MSAFAQAALAVAIYNIAVLAGCAYWVAAHDWSGWWFLLAIALCKSVSDCECECECEGKGGGS